MYAMDSGYPREQRRTGRRPVGDVSMKRRRTLFLTDDQDSGLESVAERLDVTVSEVVRQAVDDLLEREGTL